MILLMSSPPAPSSRRTLKGNRMRKTTVEQSCEQFFLNVFANDPALKQVTMRHFDDQRRGEVDCIVVEATQGNHNLAGCKGYDVIVTAEYRSGTNVAAQNDSVADAMSQAIYDDSAGSMAMKRSAIKGLGFSDFIIDDEMTSDRTNTKNMRKRVKKFPLIVKMG